MKTLTKSDQLIHNHNISYIIINLLSAYSSFPCELIDTHTIAEQSYSKQQVIGQAKETRARSNTLPHRSDPIRNIANSAKSNPLPHRSDPIPNVTNAPETSPEFSIKNNCFLLLLFLNIK